MIGSERNMYMWVCNANPKKRLILLVLFSCDKGPHWESPEKNN